LHGLQPPGVARNRFGILDLLDAQAIQAHQLQRRFEQVFPSDQNGFRLTWSIFLESIIEDFTLGVGEHEIAFLNIGRQEFPEPFTCHVTWRNPPLCLSSACHFQIKNMRYHLAARYARRVELCGYRKQLLSIGATLTSRWLDFRKMPSWSCRIARDDCEDLLAADAAIILTEIPNTILATGGRHVEFGLALAQGKRVIVVGPREQRVPLFAAGLSDLCHMEQGICDNKASAHTE
jgi:hypothetical protein